MGFTFNEKIKTELTWLEVALITAACEGFKKQHESAVERFVLDDMQALVTRLGKELVSHPDNVEPNGH